MLIPFVSKAFCMLGAALSQGEDVRPALPESWHGVWIGKLVVHSQTGKTDELPMELHIGPIEDRKAYTWRIIYGVDKKRQVRNYELLPEGEKAGHFKIDEKNGIVIDARLMGDAIYCYFKVNEVLISAKYERRGECLFVEIASVGLKEPRVTGIKSRMFEVEAYRLEGVQVGELKKKGA